MTSIIIATCDKEREADRIVEACNNYQLRCEQVTNLQRLNENQSVQLTKLLTSTRKIVIAAKALMQSVADADPAAQQEHDLDGHDAADCTLCLLKKSIEQYEEGV